jgi:hypothetical protein
MSGDVPELDQLEILLPAIPIKGDDNFDVTHKGVIYNCSVIDVDWIIREQEFSHCNIYIK